jgi:hypothetical protein
VEYGSQLRANIGSDRRIRVKIRMAPPRLARRISWRRHEITFRPLKFGGEAATKFRAWRRFSHPYLPPYSLVARRYSTEFAGSVSAAPVAEPTGAMKTPARLHPARRKSGPGGNIERARDLMKDDEQ